MKSWEKLLEAKELKDKTDKAHQYSHALKESQQQKIAVFQEAQKNYEVVLQEFKHLVALQIYDNTVLHEIARQKLIEAKVHLDDLQNRQVEIARLKESKVLNRETVLNPTGSPKLWGRAQFERLTLQKQLDTEYKTVNSPIRMRIITAIQSNLSAEFNSDLTETGNEIIERLLKQIANIATIAHKKHLDQNCYPLTHQTKQSPPPLIREDKKNDVTCLMFPEFSFYAKIPLSISEFNTLCEQLKIQAALYIENFHMLLGTFSVKDKKDNVYNIAIYIECGKEPKLTLTKKALSSRVDLYYPATRLPYFYNGSAGEVFHNKIKSEGEELCKKLTPQFLFTLNSYAIDQYINLCQCNADYPPPDQLIQQLKNLKEAVNHRTLGFKEAAQKHRDIAHFLGLETAWEEMDKSVAALINVFNHEDNIEFIDTVLNDSVWTAELNNNLKRIRQLLRSNNQLSPEDKKILITSKKIFKEFAGNRVFLDNLILGCEAKNLIEYFKYFPDKISHVTKAILTRVNNAIKLGVVISNADLNYLKNEREKNLENESVVTLNAIKLIQKAYDAKREPSEVDILVLLNWNDKHNNHSLKNLLQHVLDSAQLGWTFSCTEDDFDRIFLAVAMKCLPVSSQSFIKDIENQATAYFKENQDAVKTHAHLLDRPIEGINGSFGRTFYFKTLGGAKGLATSEICLDHQNNVSRQNVLTMLNKKMHEAKETLSSAVSHMIVSCTISVYKDSALSDLVFQADPVHNHLSHFEAGNLCKISPAVSGEITDIEFGNPLHLKFFKPQELKNIQGDYQEKINLYNRVMGDYLFLKKLSLNYPKLSSEYKKCMLLHLLAIFNKEIFIIPRFTTVPGITVGLSRLSKMLNILQNNNQHILSVAAEIQSILKHFLATQNPVVNNITQLIYNLIQREFVEVVDEKQQPLILNKVS